MIRLSSWASALFLFCCLLVTQLATAQCINGPSPVCGGSTHTYTIDPNDVPPGTSNTIWSAFNGAITAPTGLTATDVVWGAQGTGTVIAKFVKSNNATISICTLEVQIEQAPVVTVSPEFTQTCTRKGLQKGVAATLVSGYCEGQVVNFTATGADNCPSCYAWSVGGNAQLLSSNGNTATVQFTTPGDAEVCATVTSPSGCSAQKCESYVVFANPVADFTVLSHPNASGQIEICLNESLTFFGSYIDPNDLDLGGYSWVVYEANPPNTIVGGGNEQVFSHTFNQAGDYVVELTVRNCLGCSDVHSIKVHVNEFEGPIITCPSVVCESQEPVLYCGPLDCANPTWTVSSNGSWQPSSSYPNCIEVMWNSSTANGYGTVTLACDNALCPVPTTVEVPIIPETPQIQGPLLICNETQTNIVYSLPFWPGTQYSWSLNASNGNVTGYSPQQTPNIFIVNIFNYTGTFTLNVNLNNIIAGCQSEGQIEVTVQDYDIEVTPGPYCYGFPNGSPTFTVVPTPSPTDFHINWTISNATHTFSVTGGVNDPALSNLNFQDAFGGSGTFQVSAEIVFASGALTCDDLEVSINIQPEVPPVLSLTGRINICPNSTVNYVAVPHIPLSTYEWQITGGTGSSSSPSINVSWNALGPYHLRVRRILNGCLSEWFEQPITALGNPDATFTGETSVCTDQVYTYTANDLYLDSYNWSANGGSIISGQGTPTVQVIWHSSNIPNPYIRLKGKLCGIESTVTQPITIIGQDAHVEGPQKICQYVDGTYSVVPGDANATYTWFLNNQIVGNGQSITLQFEYVGNYVLYVKVENYMGCPGILSFEYPVEVTPNPKQFVTQTGFLCCNQKGTVVLTSSVPANGTTFQWYHLENGAFVEVQNSQYSSQYNANQSVLTINYTPAFGPNMIGVFKIIINGDTDCPSEVIHVVGCLKDCTVGEPCELVNFTNWQYQLQSDPKNPAEECGMVYVEGTVYPKCLIDAYFQVLTGTGGIGFSNPVPVNDIYNPSAIMGPFLEPGFYLVALVGVYDCDGHGPNPPFKCYSYRYITIPLISSFEPNVTCNQNNPGVFTVNLTNTSDYLPQYEGKIKWTWTKDGPPPTGGVIGNDQNLSIDLNAGETVVICLTGEVEVEDNGQIKLYTCTFCREVSAPADLTVDIGVNLSSSCTGSVGNFTALVGNPSLVVSYLWTFTYPFGSPIFTSTVPNPTFSFPFPFDGNYTIELEVLFANGCRMKATKVIPIQINPYFVSLTQTNAPCGAKTISACDDPSCAGYGFLWSNGATTPQITVTQTGVYTVTVTTPANGCTATGSVSVSASSPFNGGYGGVFAQCEGENLIDILVPLTSGFSYTFNGLNQTRFQGGFNGIWDVPLTGLNNLIAGDYGFTITVTDNSGNVCDATLTGSVTVHPNPDPVPFTITYACDPFSALLQATQPVAWYHNGTFVAFGSQLITYSGGYYSTSVTTPFGCTAEYGYVVDGPPSVSILTGCYCIEPEVIKNGDAIVEAPNGGNYTYWEWRIAGNPIPGWSCSTPPQCSPIPDLTLTPNMQGDITLYVEQEYSNSDGTSVTCDAESDIFCWWIGPCDSVVCTTPLPTTRTISCLDSTATTRRYHIHWDFMDDGITHPCNYPQNLDITDGSGMVKGHFEMIDENLINGYWHFEGIFNLDIDTDPFETCWAIPFCSNATGQQCGIANVCPRLDNPQHDDDVIRFCTDDDLPYCQNLTFNGSVTCDDVPGNGITHNVTLTLTAVVPATQNTINCPRFSFYITSVTGTLPGGLVRVDLDNVMPVGGFHTITTTVNIPWYDQIGGDYICFQVILAHRDACWPNDGNICLRRFCLDATDLNCAFDPPGQYKFTAQCSREQGEGGVLYDYVVEFPNEKDIQKCEVKNSNPNGFNRVLKIIGKNKVRGQYLSYKGDLNFEDVFIINGRTNYLVKSKLPRCTEGGGKGDREQKSLIAPAEEAMLNIMPNPSADHVLFTYEWPSESANDSRNLLIVNALGIVQQRFALSPVQASGLVSYQVSELPNGVYQICLMQGDKIIRVKKMVVLKQ